MEINFKTIIPNILWSFFFGISVALTFIFIYNEDKLMSGIVLVFLIGLNSLVINGRTQHNSKK